jgi:hypothetical protein
MEWLRQPGAVRTFAPAGAWWLAACALGAVWATAVRDAPLGFAVAGAGLLAVAETARALLVLFLRRRAADDWLWNASGDFVEPRHAWRARQLRAACERLRLARTLRLVARRAAPSAVSENREALQLLASTLERVDQPVTPAGMLRVIDLITDGAGPLWNAPRGPVLEETIYSTLDVLRRRPDGPHEHARAA